MILLLSGLPPQGSCSPKDESTVGVDSVSYMWHIVFATFLVSTHGANPKGTYLEWRYVLSSMQILALVGRI